MGERVIYDFGMNNGDDVEYYLLKADRVIGVEANEALCELVERRFSAEIDSGRLVVLNLALAAEESSSPIPFYLHKTNHVLSQLPRPADGDLANFQEVQVPCRTPASIVREFGDPWYVKIDVEHFDLPVLENLFSAGFAPPEISAEAHDAAIFACLVTAGYRSFNLVDGLSVSRLYGKAEIATSTGSKRFRFKEHSAGPFGEDIRTPWEDPNTFLYTLASAGLGWKDRRDLDHYRKSLSNVRLIPNPVSPPIATGQPREKLIIAIGHLEPLKNFEDAIRAMALSRLEDQGWSMAIIGSGSSESRLHELITEVGLTRTQIHNSVNDLESWYARASLLLVTSRQESFSLVLAEAMFAGVVPLAYASDGPSFILEDFPDLLVEPGKSEALSKRLAELASSGDLDPTRARLRLSIEARFSPEIVVDQWREVIQACDGLEPC